MLTGRPARGGSDPLAEQLGRPGLWRAGPDGARAFDLPPLPRDDQQGRDDLDGERPGAEEQLRAWAAATERGLVPEGWQAPPRPALQATLAHSPLAISSGPYVAQAELVREDHRLALRLILSARDLDQLCATRRAWLDAVLADAQLRWRLVRLGAKQEVRAEVDLSGAPADLLEHLLVVAAASLRRVAEWILPTVTLLADADVVSRALCSIDPAEALAPAPDTPKEVRP